MNVKHLYPLCERVDCTRYSQINKLFIRWGGNFGGVVTTINSRVSDSASVSFYLLLLYTCSSV